MEPMINDGASGLCSGPKNMEPLSGEIVEEDAPIEGGFVTAVTSDRMVGGVLRSNGVLRRQRSDGDGSRFDEVDGDGSRSDEGDEEIERCVEAAEVKFRGFIGGLLGSRSDEGDEEIERRVEI
uniref:Uncharacterized protein n=1 Tax=Davidia involucrata TaxID=16924 RepID=A0A5B7BJP3_DAVIN